MRNSASECVLLVLHCAFFLSFVSFLAVSTLPDETWHMQMFQRQSEPDACTYLRSVWAALWAEHSLEVFSRHHSLPLSHYSSRLPLANVSTVCSLSASCLNKMPLCWSHISGLHKEKLRLSRQLCAFGACRGLYNLICTISPLISCRAVVTNLNAAKINKRMQGVSVKACGLRCLVVRLVGMSKRVCVCVCLCIYILIVAVKKQM